MHLIEQAFGEGCDLYQDVLGCPRDADKAQLRKKYYRAALKYHPDKNPGNKKAALQFQAVSLAYQILQKEELREDYDETGVIPTDEAVDNDDETTGVGEWQAYFDRIFGKVKASDIDAFALKYKCSDEEKRDVLKEFEARKGNLTKMLDFVMLSEARDAARWVEDYILPAMEVGQADKAYKSTMEKTLKKLEKKVAKEDAKAAEESDVDDEETETESDHTMESNEERIRREQPPKSTKKKTPPKKGKAKHTKRKIKKKKESGMDDLIAQIQNRRGGSGAFSSIAARYGVSLEDDDPLGNDAAFKKAQQKMFKKR